MPRPPKPPEERRIARLEIKLPERKKISYQAAARDVGVELTRWVEAACDEYLSQQKLSQQRSRRNR